MKIVDKVKALKFEREEIKEELFELYAEKEKARKEWLLNRIPTPLEQRITRDARIAELEADRQATKVELMVLSNEYSFLHEVAYKDAVKQVLLRYEFGNDILSEIGKVYRAQGLENV